MRIGAAIGGLSYLAALVGALFVLWVLRDIGEFLLRGLQERALEATIFGAKLVGVDAVMWVVAIYCNRRFSGDPRKSG